MKHSTKQIAAIAACAVGFSTLGCGMFIDRAVNQAVGTAANRVGEKVGEVVAASILTDLTPSMMHLYTSSIFKMLFYHGGYYYGGETTNYKVTEYTRWEAENIEQGQWFERALLHRYENGAEWWRIESRAKDNDGKESKLVMEALISAADKAGTRHVRRMRAHFPDEAEPREIPITEQNASSWVMRVDQRLTPESLEGMTVGNKTIETPAGKFETKHVKMAGYDNQSHVHWYMTDNVPGGMVKYEHMAKQDGETETKQWDLTLTAYGAGAKTSKLGIDFDKVTLAEPDENKTDSADQNQ